MPKVWILNTEEVVPPGDLSYSDILVPKALEMTQRYLNIISPGDVVVLPVKISSEFLNYVSRFNGLPQDREWLIELSKITRPYSIVELIKDDSKLICRLKGLNGGDRWELMPFIETKNVVSLSELLDIPICGTTPELISSGLIEDLNDKCFFRDISLKAGIEIVPGYCAYNKKELKAFIRELSRNNGRVIVKKAKYAGGLGNITGSCDYLNEWVDREYGGEAVVVEQYMDFKEVLGSLVSLDKRGINFIGIDKHIRNNDKWTGLIYPYYISDSGVYNCIKDLSLKYAGILFKMGARGYLNLDWGIAQEYDNFKTFPIEINFRQNGFSYIIELGMKYFNTSHDGFHVIYDESIKIKNNGNLGDILKVLEALKVDNEPALIRKPGKNKGAIVTAPPVKNRICIAFFGPTAAYVQRLYKETQKVLL